MKVSGLSGRSGTGKSYNAVELAANLGADAIIDDGLLISRGKILAGKSAKRQKTKVGAVKTAIFREDEHADMVKAAIAEHNFEHLLVLGTSDDMIIQICQRLELPAPDKIVQIESITTEEQRKLAHHLRNEEGMHTIPAPTFQVKKQFSGYIIDPARAFKDTNATEEKGDPLENLFKKSKNPVKTVVRPTYSYLGGYSISDRCITQIANHIVQITPGFSEMLFATCTNGDNGMYVRVIVMAIPGNQLMDSSRILQEHLISVLSHMTSFNILGVEVEIRGYTYGKNA